jgi:hypothetical protein
LFLSVDFLLVLRLFLGCSDGFLVLAFFRHWIGVDASSAWAK